MSKSCFFFFFFNDTATTEIYTLSLHDALPIYRWMEEDTPALRTWVLSQHEYTMARLASLPAREGILRRLEERSEEHTSELQSQSNLVCRLLLEKKKK